MDLFDDLPDPESGPSAESRKKKSVLLQTGKAKVRQRFASAGLFDDLPSFSTASSPAESLKRKPCEETSLENAKRLHQDDDLIELVGFVSERKGEREEMQDTHNILDNFRNHLNQGLHPSMLRISMYAVYDGHGGARASRHMATKFPEILASNFPKGDVGEVERAMKKYLIECFKRADEGFLQEAACHKPSWKDGTTAIVVLALNNILYISNLGDSKAVLCRYCPESEKLSPLLLSKDHSPIDYNERMRIQKAGGNIKDGRVLGILEVSRSIGDGQLKRCGVICVPEIRRCQLTKHDKFIILGCDGLWKVFTSEEVIQIVNKHLQDETLAATVDRTAEEVRCDAACSYLSNEAVRKLSGDNVTVLLVRIKCPHK